MENSNLKGRALGDHVGLRGRVMGGTNTRNHVMEGRQELLKASDG